MTTLRQYLYGLALVAAVVLLGWSQYQQHQAGESRQQLAADQLRTAQATVTRQASDLKQLAGTLDQERRAQSRLRKQTNTLRTELATRQQHIEDLQHENQALRDWAAQPLPDAARRLRQRPALTGADAYRQWLSSGNALRPAGDPAQP